MTFLVCGVNPAQGAARSRQMTGRLTLAGARGLLAGQGGSE